MTCHRCEELEQEKENLQAEVVELRLQTLEMAKYANDLKEEVRALTGPAVPS